MSDKPKSLREVLYNRIRDTGYISINEVEQIAKEYGAKQSNAERRLREMMDLENPDIEKVEFEGTTTIKGYRWKARPKVVLPPAFPKQEPQLAKLY